MFTLATSHERQSDHVPRFTPHTYTDQGMNNMYVVFAYRLYTELEGYKQADDFKIIN